MYTPQGERESQQERSGTMPLNILPVKPKPKVRKTKKNEAKKPEHRQR
jgi:hypothetical protein